jgi:cytochrome c5
MKKIYTLLSIAGISLYLASTVVADTTKGQGVYMNFCAACHASGIAGAPKVGDKAAWESRTGKGSAAVIKNAINGFQGNSGFMPAKGGHNALTDEEVSSAVIYMLERSK